MKRFLPDFVAVVLLIGLLVVAAGFINLFNLPLFISVILTLILWLVLSIVALAIYTHFMIKDLDL